MVILMKADDGAMMGRRISSLTMELAENCTYTRVLNDQAEAVDDATAGMIIVILLFVLPSSLSFWPFVERTKTQRAQKDLNPQYL